MAHKDYLPDALADVLDSISKPVKKMDMDEAAEVLDFLHAALRKNYGDQEGFEDVDHYLTYTRKAMERFEEEDDDSDLQDEAYELWKARREP